MKKIFILSLLLLSQLTFADQLPASWVDDSSTAEEATLTNLENTFDTHSDMAANLVEKDAGKRQWEMFGYVTTFGVSASGKIGLLATSGAAAVEIAWRKKPVAAVVTPNTLAQTSPEEINADDVVINDAANIDETVDEIMSVVKTKKEIRITDRLRNQIANEVTRLKTISESVEAMERLPNFNLNWYVKVLRLDLFISGEGVVYTGVIAGAELGIRVFWTRTEKKPSASSNKMKTGIVITPFAKSISNILANLESLDIDGHTLEAKKQGFTFDTIRIGLGMNASGDVVFGKGTGSAVVNVILVKKPIPVIATLNQLTPQNLLVEDSNGQEISISNEQFIRGMYKSFKISEKIITHATRKANRKFEPFLIWNIFTFTRGGSIGLVKVNGVAQIHLYFNKK